MIRTTTNGVLRSYQYNLQRSTNTLNKSRDTVLTGRRFNTFAEDPATAAHSFNLRTSLLELDSQYVVGDSIAKKYDVAWSSLNSVSDNLRNAKDAILRASSDPTAAGRNALGEQLSSLADSIVHSMNAKFANNFVFSGADGLNAPFSYENGKLLYRGKDVNTAAGDPDFEALKQLMDNEHKFVDIGLGMKEDGNGNLIQSSAFDSALHGLTFLGYGQDDDGDPKNIICQLGRMGEILQNCDKDGNFAAGEEEEFKRLSEKFEKSSDIFKQKFTELDSRAAFLKDNQKLLQSTSYSLQEEITSMENVEPADAIMAYSWAQYCYNSALKVGNSILSQSLMDYMTR